MEEDELPTREGLHEFGDVVFAAKGQRGGAQGLNDRLEGGYGVLMLAAAL